MNFRVITTLRKKVEKREGTQRIKGWHPLSPTSIILASRPANLSSLVEEVAQSRPLVPATALCGPMCLPLPTTTLSCLNTALIMATSTTGRLLMICTFEVLVINVHCTVKKFCLLRMEPRMVYFFIDSQQLGKSIQFTDNIILWLSVKLFWME